MPIALMTVSDVAEYCQVQERTVRSWVYDGKLVALRVGDHGNLRFRIEDVDRMMGVPSMDGGSA